MDQQTTLRDSIESAISEHSDPTDLTIENSGDIPSSSDSSQRARDESGRFASTRNSSEDKTKTVSEETAKDASKIQQIEQSVENHVAPTAESIQRPASWKKDYDQYWGQLPADVQKYILQREADYAKGVSMYKQNWENVAPVERALQPFMETLQKHSIQPDQWISSLGNAHLTLVQGSPEQKLQMFAKLANDYGINLQGLQGGQVDHQFSSLAQELNQLKNQWQTFQTTREQQEQAVLQNEIQNFAAQNPHFEELRETMASLLQNGMAKSLEDAYSKAIRLNDDIWQKSQAKQAEIQSADRQKTLEQKKAKAVSPKSSAPTGIATTGNSKKSLRETLAEAVNGTLN